MCAHTPSSSSRRDLRARVRGTGAGHLARGTRADRVVRAVELVNHEAEPLEVHALEYAAERFTARVETVDAGKRLRIVVEPETGWSSRQGNGPAARANEQQAAPEISLSVSTLLRERVYTFPESVDFGTVRLSDLKRNPQLARAVTQTLMVYGKDSSDFDVKSQAICRSSRSAACRVRRETVSSRTSR